MNTHWRAGSKVFATENEARQYSKDMMALGAIAGWCETEDPVTHEYVWGSFGETRQV